jgi:type IV pilus assembly protein PilV
MKHPATQRHHHRQRGQRGLTLIEVLVAILIFSFGLLGFVGLQARAIQFSVGAEDSNRAALLANEMATTMLTRNTIDETEPGLAAAIVQWQARAASTAVGLPNGSASAVRVGNVSTLTLTWRPTNAASTSAASTNKYVTQVILPP